jgi:hypothetical protein
MEAGLTWCGSYPKLSLPGVSRRGFGASAGIHPPQGFIEPILHLRELYALLSEQRGAGVSPGLNSEVDF